MAGKNTGRQFPGSTPRGDTARAGSIRCCQSRYSSSAPGTPSPSRTSDWWLAGARDTCSHNRCAPHTGHHAAQSLPDTDTPPGTAGDTAPRVRPSWRRSEGRRWCTRQNDCCLDREELRWGKNVREAETKYAELTRFFVHKLKKISSHFCFLDTSEKTEIAEKHIS